MNHLLFLLCTFGVAGLLLFLAFLRYRKRGIFLDPFNMFLFWSSLYFIVQVPFVFFPGNLYMIGLDYRQLSDEIWSCFGIEALAMVCTVGATLFLFSSYPKRDLNALAVSIVRAAGFLAGGHRLYLLFLIPIAGILAYYVAKFGATLFLVSDLGAAKARTVVLREAAGIRFLFNFANAGLALILYYSAALLVDLWFRRRWIKLVAFGVLVILLLLASFVITGTRSFALGPIIDFTIVALMFSRGHNTPGKVFAAGFALIFTASLLDTLRHGGAQFFLYRIFFEGNTFADFRDFVWSYHNFKRKGMEYFAGNTYFASWLSFIPASFFPFREEWAYGRAIMRVVGWSSEDHFGIRSGLVGATYFNGGLLLVVVTSLFKGMVVFLGQKVFDILRGMDGSLFAKVMMLYACNILIAMLSAPLNNTSLWTTYVAFLIVVGAAVGYPLLRLRTKVDNRFFTENFGPR